MSRLCRAHLLALVVLGCGATPAAAITGPPGHAFPDTRAGQTATETLTFQTSRGPTDAGERVSAVAIGGPGGASFLVVDDRCTGRAITSACTVTVRFAPAAGGRAEGSLAVYGEDGAASTPLRGVAYVEGARIVPTPAALDFGTLSPATLSPVREVTFVNEGDHAATVTAVTSTTSDFAVVAESCSGRALAPTRSCAASVRFAPSATSAGGEARLVLEGVDATSPLAAVPLAGAVEAQLMFALAARSAIVTNPRCRRVAVRARPRGRTLTLRLRPSCRSRVNVVIRRRGARARRASVTVGLGATGTVTFRGLARGRWRIGLELVVGGRSLSAPARVAKVGG
jgi:hypothetical protein